MVASLPSKRSDKITKSSENTPKTMTTRKRRNSTKPTGPKNLKHGQKLVGSKIEVWWPMDRKFYPAVVQSYDSYRRKHQVLYVDGEEERLNLKIEKWKFAAHELVEKSGRVQAEVEQSSSPKTSLHEKKQSSDADSTKVKHSVKETSQHMGDSPAQKTTDLDVAEKAHGDGGSASVSNLKNGNALSGEELTLLNNCVVALNKLNGIDGPQYVKFAKVLHNDAVWRQMFMLMPDQRKRDMVLHY